jgi:hypothetical protein
LFGLFQTSKLGGTRLNLVLELEDAELARAAWQQWQSDLLTLKELLEFMA